MSPNQAEAKQSANPASTPRSGSAADFLDAVRRSGLMSVPELRKWIVPGTPMNEVPPRDLAARMVRQRVLTGFQAHQILAGRYRNFILQGKYRVLDLLGVGAAGSVFLCEHVDMKRRVAVKMIPPGRLTDESLHRFQREAAMSSLIHPNLVHALDCDHDGPLYFLVMEYVEGIDLMRLVKVAGSIDYARAASYVAQAAAGLHFAFETGWVHRDVKPSNLLVDRYGRVRVADMGVARLLLDVNDELTRQVEEQVGEQTILGSVDFMSPEQAHDSHDVDIRTDIYGLGATLYYLLTSRSPLGPGTLPEKMLRLQRKSLTSARTYRPDMPADLEAVMCRMMAKRPEGRYETPAAAAQALRECDCWSDSLPPLPLPPGREERLYEFALEKPVSKVTAVAEKPATKLNAVQPTESDIPAPALPARRRIWVVGLLAGLVVGALAFLASRYVWQI